MILETSRGTLQSLPGNGAPWEGRALWFASPGRREAATMAPKKKGKKGKGKGTPIVDGLAPEDMSKEQVEEHIGRIREELDREREERNYFQLERDKIHTFWEITRRQLEEKKAELRNKDREMEEAEERHQVEIKVYKQKVKHLLYEHQSSLTEMKAEGTVVMKLAQKEHRAQEGTLRRDMRALKVELKEQELANEVMVKNLRLKHTEEITKMRNDFERQVREIEAKYDKKMKMLRDELDLRRKTEIHEVEERKNGQITTLMQRHEEAFTDIKNYYNDITLNNLALINSLKEQMEDMRKKEEHLEKEMTEVAMQNRRLADPLQKAREEMSDMQKKLGGYERDKQILVCTKARLKVTEKELKSLRWEHEVLEQRFIKGLAEGRAPRVSAVSTFSTETLSQTVMVERTQFLGNIPQAAGSGVTPKGPPRVLQATGRRCSCWSRCSRSGMTYTGSSPRPSWRCSRRRASGTSS
nr:growth arrest-specific protein 8 isoform X2 [Odocoileus virginianus texanus]